ncbi:flagellin [Sphingomonas sp. RHCKR7]|uniref:flagellin n=1 Tax=Sphingomonas folli TaxID=2862497 RepID=UPI001CA5A39E|nr:flagellin [Sphingomonas folli]MBW6525535.1 flagellin [Sphingomonas folli]
MVYSVNTNLGAYAALQNLQATQHDLLTTQNRVNTGLSVSSAKDDSATYVVAEKLRGNVRDYGVVSRSISNAKSVVDTALAAAEVINEYLGDMRSKALEAKDPAKSSSDREIIQRDIQEYWNQIKTSVQAGEFNGVNLFKGDTVSALTSTKTMAQIVVAEGAAPTTPVAVNPAAWGGIRVDGQYTWTVTTPTATGAAAGGGGGGGGAGAATPGTVLQMLNAFLGAANGTGTARAFIANANARSVRDDNAAYDQPTGTPNANLGVPAAQFLDYADQAVTAFAQVVGRLGAAARRMDLQLTFTSKLTDALNAGVGNLVDADMAKESTKLQALQVKQQLGIQALSIANQQPQVLQNLFRG